MANVIYKTLETTLNPDGRLGLPPQELPEFPVKVMVTILQDDAEPSLSELGDYVKCLADYEERLSRGEIQWE